MASNIKLKIFLIYFYFGEAILQKIRSDENKKQTNKQTNKQKHVRNNDLSDLKIFGAMTLRTKRRLDQKEYRSETRPLTKKIEINFFGSKTLRRNTMSEKAHQTLKS